MDAYSSSYSEWNADKKWSSQCEGGGDVVGVVTPLVGGVAQAFHDDRVVELRVQLGVQEKRQGRTGRSSKGEASQGGAPMDDCGDVYDKTQISSHEV